MRVSMQNSSLKLCHLGHSITLAPDLNDWIIIHPIHLLHYFSNKLDIMSKLFLPPESILSVIDFHFQIAQVHLVQLPVLRSDKFNTFFTIELWSTHIIANTKYNMSLGKTTHLDCTACNAVSTSKTFELSRCFLGNSAGTNRPHPVAGSLLDFSSSRKSTKDVLNI